MGLRPLRPKKLRPINFHHDKFAVSTSTGNSHLSMISTSHLPRSLFWFLIQYYQESLQFCLLFLLCKQWGYTPESVVCHQRWNFADWIDVKLQSRGYILCCFLPQVKNYQLLMIVQRPWTEELNGAGQHPMMGQMIWVGQHPNGAGNIRWSGLVNVHGLMCWLGLVILLWRDRWSGLVNILGLRNWTGLVNIKWQDRWSGLVNVQWWGRQKSLAYDLWRLGVVGCWFQFLLWRLKVVCLFESLFWRFSLVLTILFFIWVILLTRSLAFLSSAILIRVFWCSSCLIKIVVGWDFVINKDVCTTKKNTRHRRDNMMSEGWF